MANPVCFLEISVDDKVLGTVEIVLRRDVVPKTAEAFRELCSPTREKGFNGSIFYRIVPKFMMQAGKWLGDSSEQNPDPSQRVNGGVSVYGESFPDENFILRHTGPGTVSMVNTGPNTNCTEFFVCANRTSWLDGKHVVFGFVRKGLDIIEQISEMGLDGTPTHVVRITDCGELTPEWMPKVEGSEDEATLDATGHGVVTIVQTNHSAKS